ncbi:hypothetical protein AYI70_g7460 [Smittium culicis]|uniref:Replication-associated protein n=1 Tax=Smittium culicis TaxID=133412 RepID=A0A1R1XKK0_9FUNG|nr:hypothetical protein AYI70_g7460 [Smittium culicis]
MLNYESDYQSDNDSGRVITLSTLREVTFRDTNSSSTVFDIEAQSTPLVSDYDSSESYRLSDATESSFDAMDYPSSLNNDECAEDTWHLESSISREDEDLGRSSNVYIDDCAGVSNDSSVATSKKIRYSSTMYSVVYPVELNKEEIKSHFISNKWVVKNLEQYLIGTVANLDGTKHILCYLNYLSRNNFTKIDRFKIGEFQGEITSITKETSKLIISKCLAGNDYVSNMKDFQLSEFMEDASFRIAKAPDFESAMKIVNSDKYYKRKHINNPQKLEAAIKYLKTSTGSPVDPNYKFYDVPKIRDWNRLKQCLWLFGPRDLGKTAYARSLFKNPLVVKSLDTINLLKYDNDGIIFDDMEFSKLSREQTIHLLDIETSSPVYSNRSRKEYLIRTGLPRVFTSNVKIFIYDESIQKRLSIIKLVEDLRDASAVPLPVNPLEPSRDMFLGPTEYMDRAAEPARNCAADPARDCAAEPARNVQPSLQQPVNPIEPSRDMFFGSNDNLNCEAETSRNDQQRA